MATPASPRRRRTAPARRAGPASWLALAAAAALLAVAGWLALRGEPAALELPASAPPAPATAHHHAHEHHDSDDEELGYLEPEGPWIPPDPAWLRAEFNRVKAEGARQVLAGIHLNRNYPFWTRPLDDVNRWHDPLPHHEKQESPTNPDVILEIWPSKAVFAASEPIVLHARVWSGARTIAPATISGFTDSPPHLGHPVVPLAFADDGADADELAGDHVYSARLLLTAEELRAHPGPWGFRVEASVNGEQIVTMNAFVIFPEGVSLTGRYRDAIEDGSLVVYVGVRSDEPTYTQVRGQLHGPSGEDLAFAWANADVPAGASEVRLVFYGKVLHDRGVDGPYRLEHVAIAAPLRKLIAPESTGVAHVTGPYRAGQFRDDAFNANEPLFDDQLREYEDLLARAERGELEP
jgi:hypothetical protein